MPGPADEPDIFMTIDRILRGSHRTSTFENQGSPQLFRSRRGFRISGSLVPVCRSSHHCGARSAKKNGTRVSYLGDLRHHASPPACHQSMERMLGAKEARCRRAQGCIGPSINAAFILTIVQGGINGALDIKVPCLPGQRT